MDDFYRDFALWTFGESCDVCGVEDEEIHVYHIDGGWSTGRTLTNLIPLCRSCHQYIHHGLPHEDPHLPRVQS